MTVTTSTAKALGVPLEQAKALAEYQQPCIVCGNGMIVLPWGEAVPATSRVILQKVDPDSTSRWIRVHSFCLTEVSAGRRISDELGYTEPEE